MNPQGGPYPQRPRREKRESEDCEMEFKRTRGGGVKVRVSKHCTPQQIKMIQETRGVKPEDIIKEDY